MTRGEIVNHLTQVVVDDVETQAHISTRVRKELDIRPGWLIGGPMVPEDSVVYERYYELSSLYLMQLLGRVLAGLVV